MSPVKLAIAVALLACLAGCGAHTRTGGLSLPAQQRALAGAPAPLAALHSQAGELLPGGIRAFKARMAALRGYPVVVNVWYSTCAPCIAEFPVFQRVGAQVGRRVAFLGVDTMDVHASAVDFLHAHPVSYPSFEDPDQSLAAAIKVTIGVPVTLFYDRRGHLVAPHAGQYLSAADLLHDISRYAERGGAQATGPRSVD